MAPALAERFWPKVERLGDVDCWLWTGVKQGSGYGQFWLNGRMQPAHRVSYELVVGPIPAGLVIDHLCRVHHCVNPLHLEPVTHQTNVDRGESYLISAAVRGTKTHCPQGHPYEGDNLIITPLGRRCRECQRRHSREHARRKRAEMKGKTDEPNN